MYFSKTNRCMRQNRWFCLSYRASDDLRWIVSGWGIFRGYDDSGQVTLSHVVEKSYRFLTSGVLYLLFDVLKISAFPIRRYRVGFILFDLDVVLFAINVCKHVRVIVRMQKPRIHSPLKMKIADIINQQIATKIANSITVRIEEDNRSDITI